MTGLKIDPDGVTAYAKTLGKGAEQLDVAVQTLRAAPLGNDAFGDLGRQVHTAEAYSRASATLSDQLTRAVETLRTAADSLNQVVEQFTTREQDNTRTIKRAENR